ncbi:uncharacterized protein METZ01_LOCUS178450, partial [marine metagenome]
MGKFYSGNIFIFFITSFYFKVVHDVCCFLFREGILLFSA